MTPHYWILDGHDPIPVADVVTWGRWYQTADRHVCRDADEGSGWYVSTVFLGLDHSFRDGGPPILFETMIFGPPDIPPALWDLNEAQWRYATWAEAEAGHASAVRALRAALCRWRP